MIGIVADREPLMTRPALPRERIYDVDVVVDGTTDPLSAVPRILDALGAVDHVVYEGSTWRMAIGVFAELWIDEQGAHLRAPGFGRDVDWRDDPVAQVHRLLRELPYVGWCAYGWAAFELAYGVERTPDTTDPLLHLVIPRTEVGFTGTGTRIRTVDPATVPAITAALRQEPATRAPDAVVDLDIETPNAATYVDAVDSAVAAITSGLVAKVVLSRTVPVPADLDFPATYLAGRSINRPARSFLLSLGGIDALGYCPETLVCVDADRLVTSEPVAGTRACTADPDETDELGRQLLADPKEVFEHAISIRAMLAELSLVCEPGTVAVREFLALRRRGTVQHLGSRLTGRLPTDRSAWDAFRAVFPGVTATGVPEPAAYRQIRRLEPEPRDLYAGAVLTLDDDGTLDAALVLRAVHRRNGRTRLRAGGGIVISSDPPRELDETTDKLRGVARVLVRDAGSSGVPGDPVPSVAGISWTANPLD